MFVYTLSLQTKYTKIGNLIIEEFLTMEEERHGDKTKGFACMLFATENTEPGEPAKTGYLCSYIKQVFERKECPSVFKRKLVDTIKKLITWNASLNYYLRVYLNYALFIVGVVFYYVDLAKDLLLTYTYYHFSSKVLVKPDPNVRFQSVGGIQFNFLMPYSVSIVLVSEIFICLFVWSRRKTFFKILNIAQAGKIATFVIIVFPIHCTLFVACAAKNNILLQIKNLGNVATRNVEVEMSSEEMINEKVDEITIIANKVDSYNQQLYHINKFYRKIQILESLAERQFQIVLFTCLMVFSAEFSRIRVLFDGVFSGFLDLSTLELVNHSVGNREQCHSI
jgi:hypothetical protein